MKLKILFLSFLTFGFAMPLLVSADDIVSNKIIDLPKTTLTIGAPKANRILEWGLPEVALNAVAVEEYNLSAQPALKAIADLQKQLKSIEKFVPKNITTQSDADNYLRNHADLKAKLDIFTMNLSSFEGSLTFMKDLQIPKLRVWRYPFKKSELISLPNLLPPTLGKPFVSTWSLGPTGIVWLSYLGDIKKISKVSVNWYDFAKHRNSILDKINVSKVENIELQADYDSFSITVDHHTDVWDTKGRKIVKSFDGYPVALGFGSSKHYVSWIDNTVSVAGYYTINNLVGISGLNHYFNIGDKTSPDNQIDYINRPNRSIHIYGDHIIAVASKRFFDYQAGLEPKIIEIDPKILESASSSSYIFIQDFSFDGTRLIFHGESPTSIFVQPIDGSAATEYLEDEAGNFFGFNGRQLVFAPYLQTPLLENKPILNDPFGFKNAKKNLANQVALFKKGIAAVGILDLYQLP